MSAFSLQHFFLRGAATAWLLLFSLPWPTVCFVPGMNRHGLLQRRLPRRNLVADEFLDVEFETVAAVAEQESSSSSLPVDNRKSLLELSLDLDPQWKEARIPFVDMLSNRAIDCHLAFCVDLDGSTTYGIGVPCDPAVAVTLEEGGKTTYMNPTDHAEVVEFFADKLHEYLGTDIYLKNTPKILTITGDLDPYTANWKDTLFDETVDAEMLMDDRDEGLDFFYDFMKKELGDEEFQKTLDECKEDGGVVDKDLLELFAVPGLGDDASNVEGIEEMLKTLADQDQESPFTKIGKDLTHDGVALKLVGFHFNQNDEKSYALVQLLKPFTIVGKYIPEEGNLRFELLTPDEETLVIPRLEKICQEDLKQAGLSLSGP